MKVKGINPKSSSSKRRALSRVLNTWSGGAPVGGESACREERPVSKEQDQNVGAWPFSVLHFISAVTFRKSFHSSHRVIFQIRSQSLMLDSSFSERMASDI